MGALSKGKVPKAFTLEELLKLETDLNMTDSYGAFDQQQWSQGEDGRWSNQQTLTPQMQQVLDRQYEFLGKGPSYYEQPDPLKELYQSLMDKRSSRYGGQEGYSPDVPTHQGGMGSSDVVQGLAAALSGQDQASNPNAPPTMLGDQGQNANSQPPSRDQMGSSWGADSSLNGTTSGQQMGRPSNGMGFQGSGSGGGSRFSDTYNAGDIDKLFGANDIGSLSGYNAAEHGGLIGRLAGGLSGIPGGSMLGKQAGDWLGNKYAENRYGFTPNDPNDPYGMRAQENVIPGQDSGLPFNPADMSNTGGTMGRDGPIYQAYGNNSSYGGGNVGGSRMQKWLNRRSS